MSDKAGHDTVVEPRLFPGKNIDGELLNCNRSALGLSPLRSKHLDSEFNR
jgi:hypothetical protein